MHKTHPVADLFPMLPDDELKDLATDIAERGLLQPIVLDAEGRILDGRNRYAACELASVEPEFTTYDGDDPDGYALAVNIARRHLTKGQQAMVAAKAVLLSNTSIKGMAESMNGSLSRARIQQAKTVLDHAPDLADSVISGATSLNDAYDTARQRKQAAQSTEAKLARLREQAPDLADQVVEDRLALAEALAAQAERERQVAEQQRDARELLARAVELVAPATADDAFVDAWIEHLGPRDRTLDDLLIRAERAARVLLLLNERAAA